MWAAGEIVVLRQLREVEIVRAPAIVGESALLADTIPAVRTRIVTYRRALRDVLARRCMHADASQSAHIHSNDSYPSSALGADQCLCLCGCRADAEEPSSKRCAPSAERTPSARSGSCAQKACTTWLP